MHTGFGLIRAVCFGFVVVSLAALIKSLTAKGLETNARMLRIARSRDDLLQWAHRNGYTILFREAVRENPFQDDVDHQLTFRVVVRDARGATRQGIVWCGVPLKVWWEDRIAFAAESPPRAHPLWDRDLDA
jgi:hypothetical protein